MDNLFADIAVRLGAAWLTGAAIGLDRSYHDKPAGFRTYSLVSLAAAMIVVMMVYQDYWLKQSPVGTFQSDPMRVAQAVLLGIGFLGAGTIFRERQMMRGLTTAASIWLAASLGILYGAGFFEAALLGTAIALITLILLRGVESRLPSYSHALHELHFPKAKALPEKDVRALLRRHDIDITDISYRLRAGADTFEYHMTLRTLDQGNFNRLSEALLTMPDVMGFRISPTDD